MRSIIGSNYDSVEQCRKRGSDREVEYQLFKAVGDILETHTGKRD